MTDVDQLIAEVARRTGLLLDKADPVLAAAVLNEVLLEQALVKLDRQVKVEADRMAAASAQAVLDAQKAAEALLTQAGEWIEARIRTAGDAAASRVLEELGGETLKVERARHITVCIAWGAALASFVALSAVAGVILGSLR